jgi:hypothetical protein
MPPIFISLPLDDNPLARFHFNRARSLANRCGPDGSEAWQRIVTDHPDLHRTGWPWRGRRFPEIRAPIVASLGDSSPEGLDRCPAMFEAMILITELTFVAHAHRKEKIHKYGHMHLDDLLARRDRFRNEAVIATHFSTRDTDDRIRRVLAKKIPDMLDGRPKVWLEVARSGPRAAASVHEAPETPHSVERDQVAVVGGFGPLVAAAGKNHEVVSIDGHARVVPGGLLHRPCRHESGEAPIDHVFREVELEPPQSTLRGQLPALRQPASGRGAVRSL